jgi:formylglycine-generating enzyme required for sulfatase activity
MGKGRVKEGPRVEDFYPGDLCLRVTGVIEDSIAWQAGLRRDDLVVRLNNAPCGDGLFVQEISPESPAADNGIKLLARIDSIDGDNVEIPFDWIHAGEDKKWKNRHSHRLVIEGKAIEARCSGAHGESSGTMTKIFGISPGSPSDLIHGKAPDKMTLLCLKNGDPVTLSVSKGEETGLACEVTAYPLILSPKNRLRGEVSVSADPGSYLLFIRSEDFEAQRYPIVVPRGEEVTARVKLLEEGATPPGYVYIPPGSFIYGGDPKAFNAGPLQVSELDGFFIAEKEVTNEEWFDFVNDEETLKKIQKNNSNDDLRNLFLPRQSSGLLARKSKGRWEPSYGTPETSVMGISRYEIFRYVDWRNKKAKEANARWEYSLAGEKEWEKAARGVDGRFFPWGDRFDFSLAVLKYTKKTALHSVPGCLEPRDRSPFGVADMGGSRTEWTREESPPGSGTYTVRGGAWPFMSGVFSRCATRSPKTSTYFTSDIGFRLIALPRE